MFHVEHVGGHRTRTPVGAVAAPSVAVRAVRACSGRRGATRERDAATHPRGHDARMTSSTWNGSGADRFDVSRRDGRHTTPCPTIDDHATITTEVDGAAGSGLRTSMRTHASHPDEGSYRTRSRRLQRCRSRGRTATRPATRSPPTRAPRAPDHDRSMGTCPADVDTPTAGGAVVGVVHLAERHGSGPAALLPCRTRAGSRPQHTRAARCERQLERGPSSRTAIPTDADASIPWGDHGSPAPGSVLRPGRSIEPHTGQPSGHHPADAATRSARCPPVRTRAPNTSSSTERPGSDLVKRTRIASLPR